MLIILAHLGIAFIFAVAIILLIKVLDRLIPARDPIDKLAGDYTIPRERAQELIDKQLRMKG